MKRTLLTLDEIHATLLDLLKYIDSFCREHSIRYSIAGGTLIGAIRHRGFIPWDDDADIMMPRPDYERFLELFPKEAKGQYKVLNRNTEKHHWFVNCYAKIEDTSTISEERGVKAMTRFGLNIDLFPVDGAPDSPQEQKDVCRKVIFFKHRITHSQKPFYHLFLPHQGAPMAFIQAHFHKVDYWLDECEKLLRERDFSTSSHAGALCGMYREREVFERRVFEEYTDYEFEGVTLMGIKDAHTYLSGLYGDYMTPPPASQRRGKHHLKVYRKDNRESGKGAV